MVKKRISVITLSYNNLEYYKECLQSIVKQTYEDIEWILCDDCSNSYEETEKNIKEFLLEHRGNIKNIIMHHNPQNLGVVKNYKQAIDMATGEYIFYLAIDDMFYDNDVLSDVVEYFEKTEFQIFTGFREVFYEDGSKKKLPCLDKVQLLKSGDIESILNKNIRIPMIAGACTPFKKKLVEEQGFVEERYKHLEDLPRYLNLWEKNIQIGFIERCLIKYRAGGITERITNTDLIRDFKQVFDKYMRPPYSDVLIAMKEKKHIIAWGSSRGFLQHYKTWEKLVGRKIDMIVDGNSEKWGTLVEGFNVHTPQKIKEFPKDDIYVLVFSQVYYFEISKELEKMGLEEGKNFELISELSVVAYPDNYKEIGKEFNIYRGKKVFLFGASSAAEKIVRDFTAYDIEIEAFVDNDEKKAGKQFFGKKIITFCELKNRVAELHEYIIQISSSYENEIAMQLKSIGANYIMYTEYYHRIWGRTKKLCKED